MAAEVRLLKELRNGSPEYIKVWVFPSHAQNAARYQSFSTQAANVACQAVRHWRSHTARPYFEKAGLQASGTPGKAVDYPPDLLLHRGNDGTGGLVVSDRRMDAAGCMSALVVHRCYANTGREICVVVSAVVSAVLREQQSSLSPCHTVPSLPCPSLHRVSAGRCLRVIPRARFRIFPCRARASAAKQSEICLLHPLSVVSLSSIMSSSWISRVWHAPEGSGGHKPDPGSPLFSRNLHIYLDCTLFAWPYLRIWISDASRGSYRALVSTEEGSDAPHTDLVEIPSASNTRSGEDIRSGPAGHIHPGDCTWRCSHLHIVFHVGFLILALALLVLASLCWVVIQHSDVFHAKAAGASSLGSTHNDYVLDPAWDFGEPPRRREYHWTVSDVELNPDGIYRPMVVVNHQFPGPLIECNEGDTLVVTVENRATNATSIHWHGIYQNSTNHMDGTVGVTQCPIAPGQTFTYEFKIDKQSGTYWYHGHVGLQASDGLLGPLIVHSKDERELQQLYYATDRVLMVQDHYHDLSGSLLMQYLASDAENEEPVPDGALINGMNVRNCDDFPDRKCDNSTTQMPVFALDPALGHRIRVVNVGTFAEFQIHIDEHEFAVTEVDGTDVQPAYYHRLNIQPAQRYSIILAPQRQPVADSYWLRARMITSCFAVKNPHLEPEIRAVIQYRDIQAGGLPESIDWSEAPIPQCKDMNTTDLVPVKVVRAPESADAFFYLRSNFEIGAWRLSRGFFNTSSWRPNMRSPLLSRSISGLADGNQSYSISSTADVNSAAFDLDRELVIQTDGIQVIDLVLQNFDDGSHPMHLHGYKFFVLAAGQGHFNASAIYPSLDLSNPLRRDTASLDSYGWLLIRFVADNPGVWAFHCHVSWHAEAGLFMNFLTRTDVLKDWKLPAANQGLCNAPGLEKGMSPDDHIWYGHDLD